MNDQIEILDKALENLRDSYAENVWHLFLWGFLILAACAMHCSLVIFAGRPDLVTPAWLGAVLVGSAVEIVHGIRHRPTGRSASYFEKAMGIIWGLIGVSMFVIAFVAPAVGLISYAAIIPLLMVQIWIATMFTGIMTKFRPLYLLSNIWLVSAVVILFVDGANQLFLLAICMIVGYLIPGFIARAEKNK